MGEDNNTRKPTDEEAESIDMATSCSEEESETRKGSLGQVTKYFGVSFTQTFVEFGVFAFLEAVGLSFGISNTLAVICSGAYNFMMNRNITFKASSNFTRSVILFVLLYAWNLVFGNVMLGLLPGMLGISTTIVVYVLSGHMGLFALQARDLRLGEKRYCLWILLQPVSVFGIQKWLVVFPSAYRRFSAM